MNKAESRVSPMPPDSSRALKKRKSVILKEKQMKLETKRNAQQDKVSRLEKYEELDRNHPLNKPFQGNPRFRGPVFKRKYTNIVWVIFFIICNGGFGFYAVKAWLDGAPRRLTNGMDFRGEICGLNKLKSRMYLYFANPSIDLNVKFCVEECPTTSGQQICLYDVDPNVATTFCYTQSQATANTKYCYPTEPINKNIIDEYLANTQNYIKRIIGDIYNSFDLMAVGAFLSLMMASIFLRSMHKPKNIKYIVWVSIWCTVFVCLVLAYFFYREYQSTIERWCINERDRHNCGGTTALMWKYLAYATCGFSLIYILIIMKLFNRINLGIGTLQATIKCSKVFEQLKHLPWFLALAMAVIVVFFFFGLIWGFSVGDIIVIDAENIDGGKVKTIVFNNLYRYLVAFNFFMLQWWIDVILLTSDTIQAYALSMWYFERRKETVILPVTKICTNVVKYHLGTIIQLAFMKIVFRPFRMILSIYRALLRKPQQHRNIVRFFQACCVCCIHVYERFLRYQSKYSLVQTVMWSESYRYASKRAFFLLFRHRDEIRNLDDLCTFILFLTKVVCSLFGGVLVYIYIVVVPRTPVNNKTSDIETPLVPAVLVFYVGYFFSSIFQGVMDIANKTLLQCFLLDSEMFVGEQRFAEKTILEFIEFFRPDGEQSNKFGKVNQYVKGIKATLDANLPEHDNFDPDDEENAKFDKKPLVVKEEEYESDEGEVDNLDEEEKKEESSEEESDDSDEDSDEYDEDAPENLKGSIFGSQPAKDTSQNDFSIELGQSMNSHHFGQATSSQNTLLASLPPVNKSYLGKSNLSFFGKKKEDEKKIEEDKKEDVDEEEESEDESEEEEEEKSQVGPLFGSLRNNRQQLEVEKEAKEWQSLEMSSLTHNQTVNNKSRREFLKNRADKSAINLDESHSSASKSKVIDKSGKASNAMKGDLHNIFNKSKVADNTTMKLEYDDDDDANAKYRL